MDGEGRIIIILQEGMADSTADMVARLNNWILSKRPSDLKLFMVKHENMNSIREILGDGVRGSLSMITRSLDCKMLLESISEIECFYLLDFKTNTWQIPFLYNYSTFLDGLIENSIVGINVSLESLILTNPTYTGDRKEKDKIIRFASIFDEKFIETIFY